MGILGNSRGRKSPVAVRLAEFKGVPLCDIRTLYYDRKEGEWRPTKKGIALTSEKLADVLRILGENIHEVGRWLGWEKASTDDDRILNAVKSDAVARGIAASGNTKAMPEIDVGVFGDRRITFPYLFEREGGVERVYVNQEHPLHQVFEKCLPKDRVHLEEAEACRRLMRIVFQSYAIAAESLEASNGKEYGRQELEAEWDRVMKMYLASDRDRKEAPYA